MAVAEAKKRALSSPAHLSHEAITNAGAETHAENGLRLTVISPEMGVTIEETASWELLRNRLSYVLSLMRARCVCGSRISEEFVT